ncbi:hypothetical protein QO209_18745 [Pseudomonas citronellolis]|uniref:hypothetical protein n=1 Tax=Pseudomonas citronellolis TaxID=53408 RepID=UPI0026479ADD|nr:hypothetical protein [Pseudomonas citronellolis]MDN6874486.1 hypothetical protein [Pseudomonas citronellolis]
MQVRTEDVHGSRYPLLLQQLPSQQAEENSRQAQAELQQRLEREDDAREQLQAEQLTQRQAEQARIAQEKRFESAQCQFWWQQHQQNPTKRTAKKKRDACEN